jgi:hypothetical protein
VRYLYDPQTRRRLKTAELIVESVPWTASIQQPRRRDDEIVAVRVAFEETELSARAMRLSAVWRAAHRLWEISWSNAKRLGIADRVVQITKWVSSTRIYMPA